MGNHYFTLGSDEHERLRLKTFSARTKGASATITITLETEDTFALAHALRELAGVQQGQAEQAKPKPRRKVLAHPAPSNPNL